MSTNAISPVFGTPVQEKPEFSPEIFPLEAVKNHYIQAGVSEHLWSQVDQKWISSLHQMMYYQEFYPSTLHLTLPAESDMADAPPPRLPNCIQQHYYRFTRFSHAVLLVTNGEEWWKGERVMMVNNKHTLLTASVYLAVVATKNTRYLEDLPKPKRPVGRPASPEAAARKEVDAAFKVEWQQYIERCQLRKQRIASKEEELRLAVERVKELREEISRMEPAPAMPVKRL